MRNVTPNEGKCHYHNSFSVEFIKKKLNQWGKRLCCCCGGGKTAPLLWTRLLGVRTPGADARELRDRQLQRRPNRRVSWISVGRIRVVSLLVSIYGVRVLESPSK